MNKALENARKAGVLKKNQDAEIRSGFRRRTPPSPKDVDLATLCIVSKMEVLTGDGEGETAEDCLVPATIAVTLSDAPKCVRCWNHNGHVGEDHDHAELCPRCAAVVRAL